MPLLPSPDLAAGLFDLARGVASQDTFLFGRGQLIESGVSTITIIGSGEASVARADAGVSTITLDGFGVAIVSESGLPVPGLPGTSADELVLGCGIYEARITSRGGFDILGELLWATVAWARTVDETSVATVTVSAVGGGFKCCDILNLIRPWMHELALFRSGIRIWSGPIVSVNGDGVQVTVQARDLTAWWDRRLIHQDHATGSLDPTDETTGFVDLAQLFQLYAEDAMAPENSAGVYVNATPTGILAMRNVLTLQHQNAGELLRELSRSGVDWTTVDRSILAGGLVVPATPSGTFVDDDFVAPPTVVLDGLGMRNREILRGAGVGAAGDNLFGEALAGGTAVTDYGLLEAVDSEPHAHDVISLNEAAESRIATLGLPKAIIQEGVLSQDSTIQVNRLVGGALAEVSLEKVCLPVNGLFRIRGVRGNAAVTEDGSTETIAVSFIPPGTGTTGG